MKGHPRLIPLLVCLAILWPAASLAGDFFIFRSAEHEGASLSDLYVSPGGSDANEGTEASPLHSLQSAVVRAIEGRSEQVTIWLRGGTHTIGETLYITGDIGTKIALRAYPGETPVVTGAQRITNWHETSYTGGRIWTASFQTDELRTLYAETGARQNARWPKGGMLRVTSAAAAEDKFARHSSFFVNAPDLPHDLTGAYVRLLHWWKDELSGVYAYDSGSGYLELNRPTSMTVTAGDPYWLENVTGAALASGEWAYRDGTLSYAPYENETIENTALYAGTVEQLILVSGAHDLTFDGITFARTGWHIPNSDAAADFGQAAYDAGSAIFISNATGVRFTNCTFRDIGAGAIRLDSRVRDVTVFGCSFANIGAQALYVHGQNVPYGDMVTEKIVFENNQVLGYGKNFLNAAAVLIIHARNVDIGFNEIQGGTYSAISAGWVWGDQYNITDYVRIRNNHIYSIGNGMLSDMGGIYLLGTQPNTVISGNVIHDITAYDYGGWGIYLDEGSSGITVTENLVYRCSSQGFHQHIGKGNTVINNIFALNYDGQVGISGEGDFTLERNIIVGETPHLNRTESKTGVIRNRNNLFRTSAGLFVNADGGDFTLVDDTAQREIGFIPWPIVAGRY